MKFKYPKNRKNTLCDNVAQPLNGKLRACKEHTSSV